MRSYKIALTVVGAGMLLAMGGGAEAGTLPPINKEVFVSGFSLPLGFVQDPSNPSVQYVVQQGGRIRVVVDGVVQGQDFLNLAGRINAAGNERGLLGLAFPPNYGQDGRFYVNYTRAGDAATNIARYQRDPNDPLRGLFNSEEVLLTVAQPFSNHNGGNVAFGPDGMLYIGMGDGGSANDPFNNAQNPNTLLGKMLRIDITPQQGFDIPADNPFVDGDPIDARHEIWAFGMRNPWRWSFDNPDLGGTGALVIADVGQNTWEEIDYEPANSGGGRNYGWSRFEGNALFIGGRQLAYQPHSPPIHVYSHGFGCSVTGGFVYRGQALGSQYQGRYFLADFCSGRVWSLGLTIDGNGEATVADVVDHTADLGGLGQITSFGEDAEGEIYGVTRSGIVYKIVPEPPVIAPLTDVTVQDGDLVSGGIPELESSDDMYFSTLALETGKASETHRLLYRARALTTVQNPNEINITLEGHILDIEATVTLFLRNFDTGLFEEVGQFTNVFGVDTTNTVNVPNAARFVRPTGRIVLRVKKVIILPITIGEGFPSLDDLLEITVR